MVLRDGFASMLLQDLSRGRAGHPCFRLDRDLPGAGLLAVSPALGLDDPFLGLLGPGTDARPGAGRPGCDEILPVLLELVRRYYRAALPDELVDVPLVQQQVRPVLHSLMADLVLSSDLSEGPPFDHASGDRSAFMPLVILNLFQFAELCFARVLFGHDQTPKGTRFS